MVAQTRRCPLFPNKNSQIQSNIGSAKVFCEYGESLAKVIFLAKNGRFEKKEFWATTISLSGQRGWDPQLQERDAGHATSKKGNAMKRFVIGADWSHGLHQCWITA